MSPCQGLCEGQDGNMRNHEDELMWTLLKTLLQCSILPSCAALWHDNGKLWHHMINCGITMMDCIITIFYSATTVVHFALTMVNCDIKYLNSSITNQCSFHPLSKKLHFAADRDKCRDLQLVTMQRILTIRCTAPVDITRKHSLHPRCREYGWKQAEILEKNQRKRVPPTRLCLYKMGKLHSRNLNRMDA